MGREGHELSVLLKKFNCFELGGYINSIDQRSLTMDFSQSFLSSYFWSVRKREVSSYKLWRIQIAKIQEYQVSCEVRQ